MSRRHRRYYGELVHSPEYTSMATICSGDLNNVELPDTDMVGPFMLGGLDGSRKLPAE